MNNQDKLKKLAEMAGCIGYSLRHLYDKTEKNEKEKKVKKLTKIERAERAIERAISARDRAERILSSALGILGLDPAEGWGIQFTAEGGAEFYNTRLDSDGLDMKLDWMISDIEDLNQEDRKLLS